MQQAFASPNADNPDVCRVPTVDDPKRRMDPLAKKGLIKLRDHATGIRVIDEMSDLQNYLCDQPVTDLRHPLFDVPYPDFLQVAQRRLGEGNSSIGVVFELAAIVGLRLFEAEPATLARHLSMTRDKLILLPKAVRTGATKVKDDF